MIRMTLPAIICAAAIGVGPAWAQTNTAPANPPPTPSAGKAEIGTATINPTGLPPSQRNPLLTDSSAVRIGKMVGTDIYNKNDQKLGSVDDVVADKSGQLQVIVSTGKKKVAVAWNQIEFGDAKLSNHNKLLMPDATEQSLNSLPTFNYEGQNKNG